MVLLISAGMIIVLSFIRYHTCKIESSWFGNLKVKWQEFERAFSGMEIQSFVCGRFKLLINKLMQAVNMQTPLHICDKWETVIQILTISLMLVTTTTAIPNSCWYYTHVWKLNLPKIWPGTKKYGYTRELAK